MMVAIPELDGATGADGLRRPRQRRRSACTGCAHGCSFETRRRTTCRAASSAPTCWPRASAKLVDAAPLASAPTRKVAVVLFNFPPNAGNTGTAAYLVGLRVAASTRCAAMQRERLHGRGAGERRRAARPHHRRATPTASARRPTSHARIPADDHVRREQHLTEIEAQWGPAPGRQQSDGALDLRARRALRQRLRRRAAGLRLRRRPDAPAVREGLRADARLLRLLPLAARGLRRPRGAALRHPRRARVHARQAEPACRRRAGPTG